MSRACCGGHLDVVKYLLYKLKFKLNFNRFKGFRLACKYGQLDVVKSIFEYCRLTCTKINIHIDYECAFRWACDNGYLEIVKVLLEYDKINIHTLHEKAFTCALQHRYFHIIKFLIEYSYKHNDIIELNNKMFDLIYYDPFVNHFEYLLEYKIKTNNRIKIYKNYIKTYKEFKYFYDLSKHNNDIVIGDTYNTHRIIKITDTYNKVYIRNNNFCRERNISSIYRCNDTHIDYNFILYYSHKYHFL